MTLIVRGATTEGSAAKPATGKNAHSEGVAAAATGSDAHAEGSSSATGQHSHAEGGGTQASNLSAHSEGQTTVASGSYSHAEGLSTTASGNNGSHAEGVSTTANGTSSHAQSGYAVAHRYGQHSQGGCNVFSSFGDMQSLALVLATITSNATPAIMAVTGNNPSVAASDSTVLTVPASRGFRFRIEAVARNTATGAGEFAGWTITGTIVRGSTGNARFLGTPVVVTESDAGASTWTLAVSVNTTDATYNYLAITATGEAAKTINWVAAIYATEVG